MADLESQFRDHVVSRLMKLKARNRACIEAPVTVTRCFEAGVNRYFGGGCGGYGVAGGR